MRHARPAAPSALVFFALLAVATSSTHALSWDSSASRAAKYTAQAEEDKVTSLPGWGDLDFGLYAGYVTVDELAGRALYYIFVEAKENAATAPVLLWLNGGPGCSSVGGGFMSELGPFFPTPSGKELVANPHSWHHFANVLFLDSPAFVGFSYSNTSSDKFVGDARTAKDAHAFLTGFFERYPQYQNNELWITGESYAGHYVPNLAWEILRPAPTSGGGKERAAPNFNLTGIMVGNAWTDTATDNEGAIDFWWSHAVISDDSARGAKATCDFSGIGPLKGASTGTQDAAPRREVYVSAQKGSRRPRKKVAAAEGDKKVEMDCEHYVYQAMGEMGNINIYDIYADVCLADGPASTSEDDATRAGLLGATGRGASRRGAGRRQGAAARQLARMLRDAPVKSTLALKAMLGDDDDDDPPYDACVDDEVEAYMNRADVKAALHAAPVPWNWTDCSPVVQYSYLDLLSSVLPVYHRLLKTGALKIMVFSGDIDAIVPAIGSRRWVSRLGLQVVQPWRPWVSSTQQVGGYIIDYDGLTFATVRGAGHMVPYVQPERAYALISGFLSRSASKAGPLREFVSHPAMATPRQAAVAQRRADGEVASALVKWWAFVVGGAAVVALAGFMRRLAKEQPAWAAQAAAAAGGAYEQLE